MTLEWVEAAGSRSVEGDLLGIGELARASGLPVSALRFYDGAGVLRPAEVDPRTGYRRYRRDQVRAARLVARLRRVGMPLADVCRLLDPGTPPAAAGRLVDAHLRRLEDGLADARRELSAVRTALDPPGDPMTVRLRLPAAPLAAALDQVRFAAGAGDPDRPVLDCVLVERDGPTALLVATDRYRLAVADLPVPPGDPVAVLVPAGLLDQVRPLLAEVDDVLLTGDGDRVTLAAGGRSWSDTVPDGDFPDWRRLGRDLPRRVDVDVPRLRTALAAAPAAPRAREQDGREYNMVVLTVAEDGSLGVTGEQDATTGLRIGVNRDFLLDALSAGGRGQLVLELDGPVTPLAVRVPDAGAYSLLMPVRL